jgi:uncharacterized membrane protein HdeD (DUF308 family)
MWTRNWGWIVARGVVAIIFGMIALFLPRITWMVLMSFFAAYAFIDGVAALVAALSRNSAVERPWGMLLLEGLFGIGVAALWVIWPVRTSLAFLYVLGAWGVVTGIMEIAAAIRLRKVIRHEWMLGLAGALSVAFGVVVWLRPLAGALALVWWVGAYAIVFGALLIGLGLRLRQFTGHRPSRELPYDTGLRQPT